jgi:hypothetical protein
LSTPIYHITNINNLSSIIQTGGLWCDSERIQRRFDCVGIAHENLKARRARTSVRNRAGQSIAAGGVLADYVPFYFASRSPMLYSIHTNNVAGYAGGQVDVIYLVSTVEQVEAGDRPWCFTDGHAVEAMTDIFATTELLDKIDWGVIGSWSWKNQEDDLDRKRRKQAEFLVHRSFPWEWFHRIGVVDQRRAQRVTEIITEANHQPEVVIERDWYYR